MRANRTRNKQCDFRNCFVVKFIISVFSRVYFCDNLLDNFPIQIAYCLRIANFKRFIFAEHECDRKSHIFSYSFCFFCHFFPQILQLEKKCELVRCFVQLIIFFFVASVLVCHLFGLAISSSNFYWLVLVFGIVCVCMSDNKILRKCDSPQCKQKFHSNHFIGCCAFGVNRCIY